MRDTSVVVLEAGTTSERAGANGAQSLRIGVPALPQATHRHAAAAPAARAAVVAGAAGDGGARRQGRVVVVRTRRRSAAVAAAAAAAAPTRRAAAVADARPTVRSGHACAATCGIQRRRRRGAAARRAKGDRRAPPAPAAGDAPTFTASCFSVRTSVAHAAAPSGGGVWGNSSALASVRAAPSAPVARQPLKLSAEATALLRAEVEEALRSAVAKAKKGKAKAGADHPAQRRRHAAQAKAKAVEALRSVG